MEQGCQLTVYQSYRKDRHCHQGECQKRTAAAITIKYRIPIVYKCENRSCRNRINKNQFQTLIQTIAFILFVLHVKHNPFTFTLQFFSIQKSPKSPLYLKEKIWTSMSLFADMRRCISVMFFKEISL